MNRRASHRKTDSTERPSTGRPRDVSGRAGKVGRTSSTQDNPTRSEPFAKKTTKKQSDDSGETATDTVSQHLMASYRAAQTRRKEIRTRWIVRGIALSVVVVGVALISATVTGRQAWSDIFSRIDFTMVGEASTRESARARAQAVEDLEFKDGVGAIGTFDLEIYDPITKTRTKAQFDLKAHTDVENEDEFRALMTRHNRFIREQVELTLRNARGKSLSPDERDLLCRKVCARVNRALDRKFLGNCSMKDLEVYESVRGSSFVSRE